MINVEWNGRAGIWLHDMISRQLSHSLEIESRGDCADVPRRLANIAAREGTRFLFRDMTADSRNHMTKALESKITITIIFDVKHTAEYQYMGCASLAVNILIEWDRDDFICRWSIWQ